jgi:hypothetical protein
MLRRVVWQKFTGVSEVLAASIIRALMMKVTYVKGNYEYIVSSHGELTRGASLVSALECLLTTGHRKTLACYKMLHEASYLRTYLAQDRDRGLLL